MKLRKDNKNCKKEIRCMDCGELIAFSDDLDADTKKFYCYHCGMTEEADIIIELKYDHAHLTIYEGDECNMPNCHFQAKHIVMTESQYNFFCDECYKILNRPKYEQFIKESIIAEI